MIRKYICEICDWYGTDKEVLDAPNPFSKDDSILGCPSCCEANVMHLACDIDECWNRATCHTLATSGFVRICEGHFQGITGKDPNSTDKPNPHHLTPHPACMAPDGAKPCRGYSVMLDAAVQAGIRNAALQLEINGLRKTTNTDFKQVFDFLDSIAGDGYGGMAVFEIARETMRRASVAALDAITIGKIADKAREWAGHYSAHSDGRNTFVLFAEWVEGLSLPQAQSRGEA